MAQVEVKSQLSRAFRLHGLSLHPEASKTILAAIEHSGQATSNPTEIIDRLVEAVLKLPLECSHVQRSEIEGLVAELVLGGAAAAAAAQRPWLQVYDVFDTPRFCYDRDSRKLSLVAGGKQADADARVAAMRQRYELLLQRMLRAPGFAGSGEMNVGGSGGGSGTLKTVEFAKGSGPDAQLVVLGMLTRGASPNRWYLEDPTGVMLLDCSQCRFNPGILSEGCHILAEGSFHPGDSLFRVLEAGLPPAERPSDSRIALGSLNTFGGQSGACARADVRLAEQERSSQSHYLVFVSDVWLDDAEVLSKLSLMLSGYSDTPPTALVLCGDFLSYEGRFAPNRLERLRVGLKRLGGLLESCRPVQQQTTVVLVPGPSDSVLAPLLPYPPLSEAVASDLIQLARRSGTKLVLASNPCRMQFCTQEIVVYRQQLCEKLCRQALSCPPDEAGLSSHLVRTVLSQGHLSPLALHASPVMWNQEHAMRVYPLPDLLVLADSACQHFQLRHADCLCVNPGCFKDSGFSFHVYLPRRKEIQSSHIAD